jgi:hypothetical protein
MSSGNTMLKFVLLSKEIFLVDDSCTNDMIWDENCFFIRVIFKIVFDIQSRHQADENKAISREIFFNFNKAAFLLNSFKIIVNPIKDLFIFFFIIFTTNLP